MGTYMKLLVLVFFIGIVSCTDKKKEEAETKVALEKIEAVETELDEITEDIDKKAEELEDVLKDLDDI